MLRSDLCDYSDAYIVVKENIIVNQETFAANDIEKLNNIPANVTTTNTENDSSFGEKKIFLKTMVQLSIAFQKLTE